MNILLIKPSSQRLYGKMYRTAILEPLGLEYIASALLHDNFNVKIIDLEAIETDDIELVKIIKNEAPDIIGFTMPTPLIREVKHLIKTIKDGLGRSDLLFIVGGPHPTNLPEHSLDYTGADIAIIGEGEETIVDLIQTLTGGKELTGVRGICYKKNGGKFITESRQLITNIDKIFYPSRHLLNRKFYKHVFTSGGEDEHFGSMMTSRGCPCQCIFCSSKKIFGSEFRERSVDNVYDELEEMTGKYNVRWIYFLDDCFTLNKQRIATLCNRIIEKNMKFKWTVETRVNTVSPDLLMLMKKAGCEIITYGIESGSPRILKILKKGITIKQVEDAFIHTHNAGIQTRANFMIGHPTETEEEIHETIRLAKKIKADSASFYITLPIPGTELYEMSLKKGVLSEGEYETLMWYGEPKSTLAAVSLQDLKRLQKKAYRDFYIRPAFILSKIKMLKSKNELLSLLKSIRPLFSIITSKNK